MAYGHDFHRTGASGPKTNKQTSPVPVTARKKVEEGVGLCRQEVLALKNLNNLQEVLALENLKVFLYKCSFHPQTGTICELSTVC